MDSEHRKLIITNLDKLVELTNCDDELFLTRFRSREVFSLSDVEAIRVAGNTGGKYARSHKFYDIIQTKSDSFPVLLDALHKTNQTGVLNILDPSRLQSCSTTSHPGDENLMQISGEGDDSGSGSRTFNHVRSGSVEHSTGIVPQETGSKAVARFARPPEYISNFLASKQTVLLVSSIDCEITCNRICETVDNCLLYSFEEFLAKIPTKSISRGPSAPLTIVNCEHKEDFDSNSLRWIKQKLVVVGKFQGVFEAPAHSLVKDKINWSDLHPNLIYKIQQQVKSIFGLNGQECSTLFQNLEQDILVQFIKGDIPTIKTLFKNTIPDLIKYYIPRRLVTRNIVSPNIFSSKGTDVFLISGIERHTLSNLAAGKPTSTSSNVIVEGLDDSTKFVLLEHESQFVKVVESHATRIRQQGHSGTNLDTVPDQLDGRAFHLLQKQGEELVWIKSSNVTSELQQYIHKNQSMISEKSFLEKIADVNAAAASSDPVCISDTPGMGKSVLLINIATKLMEEHKPGSVAFLVISELVEECTRLHPSAKELTHHVSRIVAESICTNRLGIAYFLKNKQILKHLLLDGLDEVRADDVSFSYELLKILQEAFPNTRLWITARPHMLLDLELCMNVLGYKIKAFDEQDQLCFLESFWSTDNQIPTNIHADKLTTFSSGCLKSIKAKINEDEGRDIAGIPLQCLLIGEVYQEYAYEYCNSNDDVTDLSFNVNSIADLYHKLVEKRFQTFASRYKKSRANIKRMKRMHIYYAISLLFPDELNKFSNKLKCPKITLQDVFNVGIIEPKSLMPIPRFIHRTLAEYFVALYLVESLSREKRKTISDHMFSIFKWHKPQEELLFNNVLLSKQTTLPFHVSDKVSKTKLSNTNEFVNHVICYFLNTFLENTTVRDFKTAFSFMTPDQLVHISESCAKSNFENIFMSFIYKISLTSEFQLIYSEKFLVLCTMYAGVRTLSLACKPFTSDKSIAEIRIGENSLLHFAVMRGNYNMVEHLVKEQGFREEISSFPNLMHVCAIDSAKLDKRTIREKLSIIKYLASICPNLVTARNSNGDLPLLAQHTHVELAKEFLSSANQKYENNDIMKYIRLITETYDAENYYSTLKYIYTANIVHSISDLWSELFEGSQLVHTIFINMDPDDHLLSFLKSSGVDFSCNDLEQQSVLELAILMNRNRMCIDWLLDNAHFCNHHLINILVHLANRIPLDLAKTILSSGKDVLNVEDISLYLHAITTTYSLPDYFLILKHIVSENIVHSLRHLSAKPFQGSLLVHTLFTNMDPNEHILSFLQLNGVYFSLNNDAHQSVLELAILKNRCRASIDWLLNNVEFTNDELKNVLLSLANSIPVDLAKTILSSIKRRHNAEVICKYLHIITSTYFSDDYKNILKHIVTERILPSFDEIWTKPIQGSQLIHKLFINMDPNDQLLSFLKCNGVDFSSHDKSQRSVLQLAIRRNSTNCIKWLLDNVPFGRDHLKKSFIHAVRYANMTAVSALLAGNHVVADIEMAKNENMLLVLLKTDIDNYENLYKVAKLLTHYGVSINVDDVVASDLLHKLITTKTTQSKEWCYYFDTLLTPGQTPAPSFYIKKARLLLHRTRYHDGERYDRTLLDILRACLGSVNNINERDGDGNSLLHLVFKYGTPLNSYSVETWKSLIDIGANPLIVNNKQETPICNLIQQKYDVPSKCLALVMHVINNIPISEETMVNNLMVLTVRNGMCFLVDEVCKWYKENVNKPINSIRGSYKGQDVTMLDMALLSDDIDVLQHLVKVHNCREAVHPVSKTLIHSCVEELYSHERKLEYITLLNDLCPELVNTPNENGLVPLSMNIKDSAYIKHLAKLGANVNTVDPFGNTPLHLAVKNDKGVQIIEALLECGADVNAVTHNNETPLMMALNNRATALQYPARKSILVVLIDNGADPERKNSDGDTFLHLLPPRVDYSDYCCVAECVRKNGHASIFSTPGKNGLIPRDIVKRHYDINDNVLDV